MGSNASHLGYFRNKVGRHNNKKRRKQGNSLVNSFKMEQSDSGQETGIVA